MLKYLAHQAIDKNRWNQLVDQSNGSKAYSYAFYLDALCAWDAVVMDDYAGGIALPVVVRYGLRQLYQPPFVQQCIWLGKPLAEDQIAALWDLLKKHFHRIHFNTNLPLPSSSPRTNLILELTTAHTVHKNFSRSLRKNLSRSQEQVDVATSPSTTRTIALFRSAYGHLNSSLGDDQYRALEQLYKQNPSSFLCVEVKHRHEAVAGLLFLRDAHRFYYILGAPNEEGRKLNAISHGITYIIDNFCQKGLVLDFEGSSIDKVKSFFESFGAVNEGFFEIRYTPNKLLRYVFAIYNKLFKS